MASTPRTEPAEVMWHNRPVLASFTGFGRKLRVGVGELGRGDVLVTVDHPVPDGAPHRSAFRLPRPLADLQCINLI